MLAGDTILFKFVPASGLYLKGASATDAERAVNAGGMIAGRGLAVTLFGPTGTTTLLPNAAALADGASLPTTTTVGAVPLVYDAAANNLALARRVSPAGTTLADGVPAAGIYLWHAASDMRAGRSFAGLTDANSGAGALATGLVMLNGTLNDKARSGSAANMSAATQSWGLVTAAPGEWTSVNIPAAATQATTTKAAGGAGVRHVCTGIVATVATGATAQTPISVFLRDGASGGGSIVFAAVVAAPANGTGVLALSGLHIVGSANTAMTLEFNAAGVTGSNEAVTLTGYSVA
jgi:hypothetical protein